MLNSGNVGIGTTTPGAKLDVAALTIEGGTPNQFTFAPVATNIFVSPYDGSNNLQFYDGSHNYLMDLYSGANDNVRIYSAGSSWFNGGNVGIGTTGPGGTLEVKYAGNGNKYIIFSSLMSVGEPCEFSVLFSLRTTRHIAHGLILTTIDCPSQGRAREELVINNNRQRRHRDDESRGTIVSGNPC